MQVYEYLGYNPMEWSFDICMDFKRKDERLLINEIHHKYDNKKYFVIEYKDYVIFNSFIKKGYYIENKEDYNKIIAYCIGILYNIEMKIEWYGDYFSAPFYLINKNGGYSLKQAKALQKLLEDALITSPEVKIHTSYDVYGGNYNIFTIMARNQRDWSKIEIGAGVTTDTEYKEEWDEYVPTGIRGIGHWYAARNLLDELSKGEEGKFWVETE